MGKTGLPGAGRSVWACFLALAVLRWGMAKYRIFFSGRTLDVDADSWRWMGEGQASLQFITANSRVVAEFRRETVKGWVAIEAIVEDNQTKGTE